MDTTAFLAEIHLRYIRQVSEDLLAFSDGYHAAVAVRASVDWIDLAGVRW